MRISKHDEKVAIGHKQDRVSLWPAWYAGPQKREAVCIMTKIESFLTHHSMIQSNRAFGADVSGNVVHSQLQTFSTLDSFPLLSGSSFHCNGHKWNITIS